MGQSLFHFSFKIGRFSIVAFLLGMKLTDKKKVSLVDYKQKMPVVLSEYPYLDQVSCF